MVLYQCSQIPGSKLTAWQSEWHYLDGAHYKKRSEWLMSVRMVWYRYRYTGISLGQKVVTWDAVNKVGATLCS